MVRRVRELRRGREARDRQGVLVTEGLHLAREALTTGAEIELGVATDALAGTAEGARIVQRLRAAGVPLHFTSPAVHASLQDARSPQPLLLVVRRRDVDAAEVRGDGTTAPLIVVAHGIQDPGNLGAIVRTAEAAGASGLLVCGRGADLHHPRTVRATMGSIFRLPAVRCTATSVVGLLEEAGVLRVGTDPAAGRDYDRLDLRRPTAILLGSEGAGLPAELRAVVDVTARIPMARGVESLSVGAAAAVLLFEAARQRRANLNPDG